MSISISASSITQSSAYLSASWSGYYNETYGNYEISITCNYQQVFYMYNAGGESASGTVTNLSPSTTYTANVYVKHDLGMASSNTTFTTPAAPNPDPIYPGVPTINSVTASGKNATINYSTGVNTSYVVIELTNADDSFYSTFNSYSSPNSGTFPDYSTRYWVRAYGVSSDGHTSAWSEYGSVVTGPDPSAPIKPTSWSWTTSIVTGGAVYQTSKINANYYIAYIITATEWNAFTAKINEWLKYKGLTTYTFTTVQRDTSFTSAIINEAISNINRMLTSNQLYYSEVVTAQLFIDMRDRLNLIQ